MSGPARSLLFPQGSDRRGSRACGKGYIVAIMEGEEKESDTGGQTWVKQVTGSSWAKVFDS